MKKACLPFDASNSRAYLPRDSNGKSAEILPHICAQIAPFELLRSQSQGSLRGSLDVDGQFGSYMPVTTLGLKRQV